MATAFRLGSLLAACLAAGWAGEAAPGPTVPGPARLDPTAAIVAAGRQIYRQRDLDALVAVAQRHAKGKLGGTDLERVRLVIARALVAREALTAALADLPSALPQSAREALVLDLLDYQAEPAPARTEAAGAAPGAEASAARGPVLVRLPPLQIYRQIGGQRRQLAIGLALFFADAGLARRMEDVAPLIQDLILGHVHRLPDGEFLAPSQMALKQALAQAIRAKLPDFPADGVLITQLDPGEAPAGK
jgi:hypothetical protein